MDYLKKPFIILIILSVILAWFNLWAGVGLLFGALIGICIGIQGTWQYIRSRFILEPRKLTKDKQEAPKL